MKSILRLSFYLLVLMGIAGCSRTPVRDPAKTNEEEFGAPALAPNPFRPFLETATYADNPRASDDWTRFRSGVDLLKDYFTKPDIVLKLRTQASALHKFLQSEAHLNDAELAEVESISFRTADAHYLDECFLLRDAARVLEIPGLPPKMQAELHFNWVMRNVLLHGANDSLFPPAFTLRRGYGNGLERAIVFLSLLRQSQIEGCLIVVPEPMPSRYLVGVLNRTPDLRPWAASTAGLAANPILAASAAFARQSGQTALTHGDLYLFDPQLGLPVATKDQKGIASLKNAIDDPTLLRASQITPEQTKQLEAWLACPLYAMSPRMQELQKRLGDLDSITLYLNAKALFDDISRASHVPVKIWNPPAKNGVLPNSPTRALMKFLPKEEGGIDDTKASLSYAATRVPFQSVMANFAQIKVTKELLPKAAYQLLQGITVDLFSKYALQPREMLLRGHYESMFRRQERIQAFIKAPSLDRLMRDETFRKELTDWQKRLETANANTFHNDPQIRATAQQTIHAMWMQDEFVNRLREIDKEKAIDREFKTEVIKKTVLTKILAVGMRDYFESEVARSQACANHEAAVRAQAVLDWQRAQEKPTPSARTRAREGWIVARSTWSNYFLDGLALDAMLKRRLEQIHKREPLQDYRENIDQAISMLETLHLDVQYYFDAKLRLAECLEHDEGSKSAIESLERTKGEIEEMESRGLLRSEVQTLRNLLQPIPLAQKRVDILTADWGERGAYFWLKQQIDRRIAALQGEKPAN